MRTRAALPLVLLAGLASPCQAEPITPEQKNFTTLVTSASTTIDALSALFGIDFTSLAFSGPYDAGGWGSSLTGTYLGLPLNVNYSGAFDPAADQVSWNATGSYGASPVSISGSFAFADTTGTWSESGSIGANTWNISGPIEFTPLPDGKFRWETPSPLTGTYNGMLGEVALEGETDFLIRTRLDCIIMDTGVCSPFSATESSGGGDPPPGGGGEVVTGEVANVPEPGTFLLAGAGFLGLLGYGWRRRKRAAA